MPLALAALASLAAGQQLEPDLEPGLQPDLQGEIDAALNWITPSTPGCAVAVSRGGELILHAAYGSADLANEVPLTVDTVFDIGSVVKQFVAAAVLLLVADDRCALSDDIREYIPELPEPEAAITIDHLLTHSSGVRDWTGLRRMSSEDEDALTMILRQRGFDFAPGDEWAYSNSGYVLLKELIARISGQSFAEFAHSRIFAPLGMRASVYTLDPALHENLAVSYEKRGSQWRENVLVGNERGGGGALLSTVGDLITWNEALRTARLGEFVTAKLAEPARLRNGRELGYTRGLFLENEPGRRVFWHTGSAGGAKALLNRFPDHELSIAILSNAGESAPRMQLAQIITDAFLPSSGDEASATITAVDGIDVAGRAGLFLSETTGDPLELVAQRGELARHVSASPLRQDSKGVPGLLAQGARAVLSAERQHHALQEVRAVTHAGHAAQRAVPPVARHAARVRWRRRGVVRVRGGHGRGDVDTRRPEAERGAARRRRQVHRPRQLVGLPGAGTPPLAGKCRNGGARASSRSRAPTSSESMIMRIGIDETISALPEFFSVITQALVAAGHEVHVITYREPGTDAEVRSELEGHRIAYTGLHLPAAGELPPAWKSRVAAELELDLMIEDSPEVLAAMPAHTARMWLCDREVFDLDRAIAAL